MKKLLQLCLFSFFVFSCTQDTFEDKITDDTSAKLVADQFDNSYLGVYKGLFTTNDGLTRGSVVVTLLPSSDGVAQITLSTGEMIELKSSRAKLTVDNTISNLRFSSVGISDIDATLDFSVEGDGLNPSIVNVNFDNKESDIVIAKNLSRAPIQPITGSYSCDNCASFPSTSSRTWNVMAIGAGNAQVFTTQVNFSGRTYVNGGNVQSGCATAAGYTTCNIGGYVSPILGYNVQWSGTHKYNPNSNANDNQCADVSGTWAVISGTGPFSGATGTFVSDTTCTGPAVANDLCTTATVISAGTYTGSTTNASASDTPTICTSNLFGSANGAGVWYSYTSATNKIVVVDTEGSGFDTQLRVLGGVCGALTCIDNDDDDGTGLLSTIQFNAAAGVNYKFFVGGYNTAVGAYTLNVAEFTVPDNDLCDNSIALTLGTPYMGATSAGNNTGAPSSSCNGVTLNAGPGTWHTFTTPTTKLIKASTVGSTFDTRLGVVTGNCGGTLTCVTANDNGPTGVTPQSELTFTATGGTLYRIYVTAATGVSGNYTLNLTEVFPPANDTCGAATAIVCGGTASGSTTTATTTGAPALCTTALNTAPGVWYSFSTPTAKSVTVNTIGSNFDTKIGVFSGTCTGGLVCVLGNDEGGFGISPQSQLVFSAAATTTYYIYVTGNATATGSFVLNVTCADPPTVPANDLCANAITIACGASASGNTTLATTTGAPAATCVTTLNTAPGVWYKIQPTTSQTYTVNTTGGNYDTKLGVFTGTCAGLVCVTGNDDGGPESGLGKSQVVFTGCAGTTYYIYVTGFGTGAGSYNVNVSCGALVPPTYTSTTNRTCGGTVIDHAGATTNYAINRNDVYYIDAGVGMAVSLAFANDANGFSLETGWDFLRVYDGPDAVCSPRINTTTPAGGTAAANGFTGTTVSATSLRGRTVKSTGRYMTVVFQSDGSTNSNGFNATVSCVTPREGLTQTESTYRPEAFVMPIKASDTEGLRLQEYNRKKLEAYKRDLNKAKNEANNKSQQAEARESEVKSTKIFYNEADRIEYYRKRKQQ